MMQLPSLHITDTTYYKIDLFNKSQPYSNSKIKTEYLLGNNLNVKVNELIFYFRKKYFKKVYRKVKNSINYFEINVHYKSTRNRNMLPKVSKMRIGTTKQGFYFQGFMLLISRKLRTVQRLCEKIS